MPQQCEGCLIANLPGAGISLFGTGTLKVTDSLLRNNAFNAIVLQEGAHGTIMNTRMIDNGFGVFAGSHRIGLLLPMPRGSKVTTS